VHVYLEKLSACVLERLNLTQDLLSAHAARYKLHTRVGFTDMWTSW